jgi:hypothetical protein
MALDVRPDHQLTASPCAPDRAHGTARRAWFEADIILESLHPEEAVTSTDAWTGAWRYYSQYTPHLDLYAVNAYGSVCGGVRQDWIDGAIRDRTS